MRANWQSRYRQAEDLRIGQSCDQLVELGIRLVCLALHNEYGFGTQRLQRLREIIQEDYIDREIKSGAEKFTPERGENVKHGIEKINDAYEKIFERKENAK